MTRHNTLLPVATVKSYDLFKLHVCLPRQIPTPSMLAHLLCISLYLSAHSGKLWPLFADYFCHRCQVTVVCESADLHHVVAEAAYSALYLKRLPSIDSRCAQRPAGSAAHDIPGEATVHKLAGCTVQSSIFSWGHGFTDGQPFKQQHPPDEA